MPGPSITYRDLRNTPGRVFERLATGEALTLVADGTGKAVLIPVEDGDVDTALDAWRRGRALLALARLQAGARRSGASELAVADIDAEVRSVRASRRRRESTE
jgi:antitoxin (DNA-binding transcriptional repressor) of toxin-antitoxin stability system